MYRILTYEDPFRLHETDFWPEIRNLPHFCSARTLVNGLKEVLGDAIGGLICPMDDFVNSPDVYGSWTESIRLRMEQLSQVGQIMRDLRKSGQMDDTLYSSFHQNRSHVLDAIRFLVELNITAGDLHPDPNHPEQNLFQQIYEEAELDSLFHFPPTPSRNDLQAVFTKLAQEEWVACKERDDRRAQLTGESLRESRETRRTEQAWKLTESQTPEAIVIHGIHQFTPVELHLLTALEEAGLTIIFLFHYQNSAAGICATWKRIYSCFGVPFQADRAAPEPASGGVELPGRTLARALSSLYNQQPRPHRIRQSWWSIYKSIPFTEFANLTDYAGHVADCYEKALTDAEQDPRFKGKGNNEAIRQQALARMGEQIYTANPEVSELLKVRYPDLVGKRHFLSYPIGQFFSALYQLWDCDRREIRFDLPLIRTCMASGILTTATKERLQHLLDTTSILYGSVATFSDFTKEIAGTYALKWGQLDQSRVPLHKDLKRLAIYSSRAIRKEDIDLLVQAVTELNRIATDLFQDFQPDQRAHFARHFQNLKRFLKLKEAECYLEEEKKLIQDLLERLEKAKYCSSDFSGTFEDLQDGIYFYLNQNEKAENSPDWIVRNFEQIEGDILRSRRQSAQERTYHFACLSDRDLRLHAEISMPWPLTESFLLCTSTPDTLPLQVWLTAAGERSRFRLYSLYYGLYFCCCPVRLSYVREGTRQNNEPFSPLTILGLPLQQAIAAAPAPIGPAAPVAPQTIQLCGSLSDTVCLDLFLCPYRYFLDFILQDGPLVEGELPTQQFYQNLIIQELRNRLPMYSSEQGQAAARNVLPQETHNSALTLREWFFFWTDLQIQDLNRRAMNYLERNVLNQPTFRGNSVQHMNLRKTFGAAYFEAEAEPLPPPHPIPELDALTDRNKETGNKVYSLSTLQGKLTSKDTAQKKAILKTMQDALKVFLGGVTSAQEDSLTGRWCSWCSHRDACPACFFS